MNVENSIGLREHKQIVVAFELLVNVLPPIACRTQQVLRAYVVRAYGGRAYDATCKHATPSRSLHGGERDQRNEVQGGAFVQLRLGTATRASEVILRELVLLDGSAHCAINHNDALLHLLLKVGLDLIGVLGAVGCSETREHFRLHTLALSRRPNGAHRLSMAGLGSCCQRCASGQPSSAALAW